MNKPSWNVIIFFPIFMGVCLLGYIAAIGYTMLQGHLQNDSAVPIVNLNDQMISLIVLAPVAGVAAWAAWKIYKGPQAPKPRRIVTDDDQDEE